MTEANLVVLPIVAPLALAVLGLVVPTPSHGRRALLGLGAAAQVFVAWTLWRAVSGEATLVLRLGGWLSTVGIALVADRLAALMVLFGSVTTLACVLFGYGEKWTAREHPLRVPLVFLLLAGVNLAFLTGDLFNLFVAFEVMLLGSYALLTLESDAKEVPAALPYVGINLLGSTVFLSAAGLCYGWLGTLNLAELGARLELVRDDTRTVLLGGLLTLVFATKAGLVPLMYWLPRAYPALPGGLAGLFGGLLTKVGVYALVRLQCTVLPAGLPVLPDVLLWCGAATLLIGGLGALSQYRIQAILTWHIVSQIGFMVLALGLGSPVGVAAALGILLHNLLVKASLLLCGGAVGLANGDDDVRTGGSLWLTSPVLGLCFLLQALSLAGLPPLSGFWGKLLLFQGLADGERWVLLVVAIAGSFLTLASMLKIWLGVFWGPPSSGRPVRAGTPAGRSAAIALLTAASLVAGLGASWFVPAVKGAADEVLNRSAYRAAVRAADAQPVEGRP